MIGNLSDSNANALSCTLHCLLLGTSDENNNNSYHCARCFHLPSNLSDVPNNLARETLHLTDDSTHTEGVEEYKKELCGRKENQKTTKLLS